MARIRGMDLLARAAGRLIQYDIRELGDLKNKTTPVGAVLALAGISRRGHFLQPHISVHNHTLNFCLQCTVDFCKNLLFWKTYSCFSFKSMLYYVQRSFMQPDGPITRLALLQRFAVCFYRKARN